MPEISLTLQRTIQTTKIIFKQKPKERFIQVLLGLFIDLTLSVKVKSEIRRWCRHKTIVSNLNKPLPLLACLLDDIKEMRDLFHGLFQDYLFAC